MSKIKHLVILILATLIAGLIPLELEAQEPHACAVNKHQNQHELRDLRLTTEQEKYDVAYYSLSFDIDFGNNAVAGSFITRLTVTDAGLSVIELDYMNHDYLALIAVSLNGEPVTFTHANHIISIPLETPPEIDTEFEVLVESSVQSLPNSFYNAFNFWNQYGSPLIWTLSGALASHTWWPCKDHPSDKPDSMDIHITVPSEYVAASNGLLQSVTENDDDTKTYHWFTGYPTATYLVTMNVYPYFVWSDTYVSASNDTMPIMFFTHSDTSGAGAYLVENYLKTNDMMAAFAEMFCEYPFIEEKYGHAEALSSLANMEHQTLSLMVSWAENIVSHELAHQWWGDMISPASFHHMWLNEGFASYTEVLWDEFAYGMEAYFEHITADAYKGGGTVYVEELYGSENLWEYNLRYRKGSFIMHMLRHVMGDEAFFQSLQIYGEHPDYKYASATTEQFQAICEETAGMDLERFFDQWIYGEYIPIYEYDWRIRSVDGDPSVEMVINQVQDNTGEFWMPIDIVVDTETSQEIHVVWDSLAQQTLSFSMDTPPANLDFDPDQWILREAERVVEFTPHAASAQVNELYQAPGEGTLILTAEPVNPDGHEISMSAMIENGSEERLPHVEMYDDGNGFDEVAEDGVFTGSWAVPEGEQFYDIDIMTTSLDSNYSVINDDLAYFTTAGPLVFGGFTDMTETTIAPGGEIWFTLSIMNLGQEITAGFVEAQLYSPDSSFTAENMGYVTFGNIGAGETADVVSGVFRVTTSEMHEGEMSVPLALDISSDGVLYWQDAFELNVNVVRIQEELKQPQDYALMPNYPNPFNPSTTIRYALPEASEVTLTVYTMNGSEVNTLVNGYQSAGYYDLLWSGTDDTGTLVSTGVYLCRLEAGGHSETIKMVYLK